MSLSPDAVRGLWASLADDAGDSAVFLGDCFFHTVEALVAVEQVEVIDPMPLFVLRAFEFAQPTDVEQLDKVLHLGRQVTRQLLSGMIVNGLVTESPPTYRLTDEGRSTLQTGRVIRRILLRRLFHFLHPSLNYVAVLDPKGNLLSDLSPSNAPSPWEFDPAILREVIARPAEWKNQHRFPQDIAEIVTEPSAVPKEIRPAAPDTAGRAQTSVELQHLIVDKSQVITCALVVRRNGSETIDLAGYAISVHGNLVRSKAQPLFLLNGPDDVHQAFPTLWSPPTPEQVTESWLALAARKMLLEPERVRARFEEGRLVILLTADLLDRWCAFVALAVRDHLHWYVPDGPFHRLCPVAVEGVDTPAAEQLQTLRAILRLEQEPKRADIVRRGEMLRDWIGAQGLPSCPSLRGLANRAFRFGRYRLAYEIGELEDMTDATV